MAACRLILGIAVSMSAVTVYGEKIQGMGGKLVLETPAGWKSVPPKINMIEHEFQVAGGEGTTPARVTLMAASGSVKDNMVRWVEQFAGEAKSNQEKLDVAGKEVHYVEIAGTFKESSGGPFAGGKVVERPNFGMLGAIIVLPDGGKYFIKMTGDKTIIDAQKDPFKKMLKEVKAN